MADETVTLAFRNWGPRFVVRGVDYGDVLRLAETIGGWDQWLPRWSEVAAEHAQQHLDRQQARVVVGHSPEKLDLHAVDRRALGERDRDPSK